MKNLDMLVDDYIENNIDKYIKEIVRLCSQPSISSTGEGVKKCANLIAEILGDHCIDNEVYKTEGNPIVVGKVQGASNRTLLFYNHYDVQPPDPLELWLSPPFEPRVTDDAIYARGSKDDKGEFISRLAAYDAVIDTYDELPCNVVFLLEGEEESGSPNIAKFVKNHADLLRADGAIWEEGKVEIGDFPSLLLGVRGVLYIELIVKKMKIDAHSGYAHILPNAAWHLNHALSLIKDSDNNILIPGFYDYVKKPTAEELRAFELWPDFESDLKEQFGVDKFIQDLSGTGLRHAVFNPTCNIAGFGSGYQGPGTKTVIPAVAKAKVDFRLVPDQDPEDILNKLRRFFDKEGFSDIEINVLGKMWPFKTPMDDPFVKLTADAGHEVYGKQTLIGPLTGGSSPEYAVGGFMDIPVVNPGIGYWDNRSHAPNEHIRIKDFVNGTKQIARILSRF